MTKDERNQMIDMQLKDYEQKMFLHEMTKTALLAVDDSDGAKAIDTRLEDLQKAHKAVKSMKEAG